MYEIGFLAMIGFTILVFVLGFIFLSVDGKKVTLPGAEQAARKERYIKAYNLDTNTIETVDQAGVTRRWGSKNGA